MKLWKTSLQHTKGSILLSDSLTAMDIYRQIGQVDIADRREI